MIDKPRMLTDEEKAKLRGSTVDRLCEVKRKALEANGYEVCGYVMRRAGSSDRAVLDGARVTWHTAPITPNIELEPQLVARKPPGESQLEMKAREAYTASQSDKHNLHTRAWSELTSTERIAWYVEVRGFDATDVAKVSVQMVVCAICGNKRCPHARDERYRCTGSNEPDQKPEVIQDHNHVWLTDGYGSYCSICLIKEPVNG